MKITFQVATQGDSSPETMVGTCYPDVPGLAVYRKNPECQHKAWIVIHLKSTMHIATFLRMKDAKAFILAVKSLLDWTLSADEIQKLVPAGSELAKKLRAIRKDCGG